MKDSPLQLQPVKTEQLKIELPAAPNKLLDFLIDIATRRDIWQKGKMVKLTEVQTTTILKDGLLTLKSSLEKASKERDQYLLNRFGTVLVPLDAAQPSEGDIIVGERIVVSEQGQEAVRAQLIVEGGYCFGYSPSGVKLRKWCAVNQLARWRKCELPVKPVVHNTVEGEVLEAMERGRAIQGNGAGLSNAPGASGHTSTLVTPQ